MNVIYEECVTGVENCTSLPRARGKVVWLNVESKIPFDIRKLFQEKVTDEVIDALKRELKIFLEKRGYVFFEECYYRCILNKNKTIREFGLNFHHIK